MVYRRINKAFTLVESLIVLTIVAGMMALSVFHKPQESTTKQVDRFLEQYQQFWNVAESHATSRQLETYFVIDNQQIQINSNNFQKIMKCPKNLEVTDTTISIKDDGYVAPQTVEFSLNQQNFSIIYSMAGGNYRVEKQ